MNGPAYGDTDPIAAFATPLAESALALIRLSGAGSIALASSVFSRPRALQDAPGNSALHGWIVASHGEAVDEVLVSVYRAPRSFSGEDSLDISCHGGIAAARAVMATLRGAGFREALAGEFSFRAFMNGKLDLTRAESVMELVSAKTDRGRAHAVSRLSGNLEGEIRAIRDLLVQILAEAELHLDYSEDEAGEAGSNTTGLPGMDRAEEALGRLKSLAASYRREKLYTQGALVAIAGQPNAGKSSLFNTLLREERSIVTEIPGTTRDWIESWISMEGIPIRLADTAGLRDSEDPVERIGIARSRDLIAAADCVVYLIDGQAGFTGEDAGALEQFAPDNPPLLVFWNKADLAPLPPEPSAEVRKDRGSPPEAQYPCLKKFSPRELSAASGKGVQELCTSIAKALEHAAGGGAETGRSSLGIGTERQKALIDTASESVEEALLLAARGSPLDIITPLLREGVNALGEITGEVSTADILEAMFSKFCVGK